MRISAFDDKEGVVNEGESSQDGQPEPVSGLDFGHDRRIDPQRGFGLYCASQVIDQPGRSWPELYCSSGASGSLQPLLQKPTTAADVSVVTEPVGEPP